MAEILDKETQDELQPTTNTKDWLTRWLATILFWLLVAGIAGGCGWLLCSKLMVKLQVTQIVGIETVYVDKEKIVKEKWQAYDYIREIQSWWFGSSLSQNAIPVYFVDKDTDWQALAGNDYKNITGCYKDGIIYLATTDHATIVHEHWHAFLFMSDLEGWAYTNEALVEHLTYHTLMNLGYENTAYLHYYMNQLKDNKYTFELTPNLLDDFVKALEAKYGNN